MTIPPIIRIFFAIELAPSIKDEIAHYIQALQAKSKSRGIRWTKAENLHITLQFLPSVATSDLETMIANVAGAIEPIARFPQFSLSDLRLFPSPYHPRVIVLDINPEDALTPLAQAIGEGIIASRYPIEARPYRAHLTIARIKQPRGVGLSFLKEVEAPALQALLVKEVTLYRSEPQREGSLYTVLRRIPLGNALDLAATSA